MPRLTIGMAHAYDFHGVYFTIQDLRMHNMDVMKDVEFIVVDNTPNDNHGKMVADFLQNKVRPAHSGTVKYVPMSSVMGTSPPRNRIFAEATGDYVLAMDCHILLFPDALASLLRYYERNPQTSDIITGPMLYDNLSGTATHFDDNWNAEMWGTWGFAWRCPCDPQARFSVNKTDDDKTRCRKLAMGDHWIDACPLCGKKYPVVPWSQHEAPFMSAGFIPLAYQNTDEPFEIPGQGLGLFSCRRDAWLGFNKDARGFGGEELYIHEKFRKAGHKALCLPKLKWLHRFGRPDGAKYDLDRWKKVRNYVLEFNELGMDLAPVHKHFVIDMKKMTQESWDLLVRDPVANESEPKDESCSTCSGKAAQFATFDEAFDKLHQNKRDLNEHMPKLRELANGARVTELSTRRESMVAFLAGKPERFTSYNTEADGYVKRAKELSQENGLPAMFHRTFDGLAEIDECDVLFLDTFHNYKNTKRELEAFAGRVKHYIVLHDTDIYGTKGDDGGAGILAAVTEYVMQHPQWSVVYHTKQQYGLTVLSCDPNDKPKRPGIVTMAANYTKAMAGYVADGMKNVEADLYQLRLETCSLCEHRNDEHCTVCGCPILDKAKMASQQCPLALWPLKVPEKAATGEATNENPGGAVPDVQAA